MNKREAARLPDWFHKKPILFYAETAFSPPTDVWETPTEIRVVMELAFMAVENLQLSYEDGFLSVSGVRTPPSLYDREEMTRVYQKEIDYGEFQVKIKMNSRIQRSQIQAVYRKGMLLIRLPKISQEEAPGEVEIPVQQED